MRESTQSRKGRRNEMRINVGRVSLLAVAGMLLAAGLVHGLGSAPLTTNTVQSLSGVITKITGAFTVTLVQYVANGNTYGASGPCTWAPASVCFTASTSGDWLVYVGVQLNIAPSISTNYVIQEGIVGVQANSITFSVPSTATTPSIMTFSFDTGQATLNSPIVLQVQIT